MTMQSYSNEFRVRHVTHAHRQAVGVRPVDTVWLSTRPNCLTIHTRRVAVTSRYAENTVDVIDTIGGMTETTPVTISPVSLADPEAHDVLRAYLAEIVSRYWGRPATAAEVDREMVEDPSDDLAPPTGTFLLARDESGPVGCVGVRLLADGEGELRRMYVAPAARGRGIGRELVAAAERAALDLGADVLKLDTRSDLVEARALRRVRLHRDPGLQRRPVRRSLVREAPRVRRWAGNTTSGARDTASGAGDTGSLAGVVAYLVLVEGDADARTPRHVQVPVAVVEPVGDDVVGEQQRPEQLASLGDLW